MLFCWETRGECERGVRVCGQGWEKGMGGMGMGFTAPSVHSFGTRAGTPPIATSL